MENPISSTIAPQQLTLQDEDMARRTNWKILQESGLRYISWGLQCPVVLVQKEEKEGEPVEYQAWCIVELPMVHLKTWFINNMVEESDMRHILTKWNYELHKPCAELRSSQHGCTPQKPVKRKLDV